MAAPVFVDSNVILDIVTENPKWLEWSADALERAGEASPLVIIRWSMRRCQSGSTGSRNWTTLSLPATCSASPYPGKQDSWLEKRS
jgi:hypothetical protein